MNNPISYQPNPETRGTSPVQFFEADGGPPPAGTKATPRTADRPREVPADGPGAGEVQFFESPGAAGDGAKPAPRR